MVDIKLLDEFQSFVPQGARSDFVNEALLGALTSFKRRQAFENLNKMKSSGIKMTTEEIIDLKNHGRE